MLQFPHLPHQLGTQKVMKLKMFLLQGVICIDHELCFSMNALCCANTTQLSALIPATSVKIISFKCKFTVLPLAFVRLKSLLFQPPSKFFFHKPFNANFRTG